jgi:hypothetical protein
MGNFLKIEDFDRQRGSSGMWGCVIFGHYSVLQFCILKDDESQPVFTKGCKTKKHFNCITFLLLTAT